jgi:hypothetical protein
VVSLVAVSLVVVCLLLLYGCFSLARM